MAYNIDNIKEMTRKAQEQIENNKLQGRVINELRECLFVLNQYFLTFAVNPSEENFQGIMEAMCKIPEIIEDRLFNKGVMN